MPQLRWYLLQHAICSICIQVQVACRAGQSVRPQRHCRIRMYIFHRHRIQPAHDRSGASCCLILASGGYPRAYKKGLPIEGLDARGQLPGSGVEVYHAGTRFEGGKYYTNGGRVLTVVGLADDLPTARERAYSRVKKISFEKAHYRNDIGDKSLKR